MSVGERGEIQTEIRIKKKTLTASDLIFQVVRVVPLKIPVKDKEEEEL